MQFNFNAGRLRHLVTFLNQPSGSDSYGEPLPPVQVFQARADVEVKSGSQKITMGEQMTTEVITCLMWFDPRANNAGFMRWEKTGKVYEVQHIVPDGEDKAMMVTARIENP